VQGTGYRALALSTRRATRRDATRLDSTRATRRDSMRCHATRLDSTRRHSTRLDLTLGSTLSISCLHTSPVHTPPPPQLARRHPQYCFERAHDPLAGIEVTAGGRALSYSSLTGSHGPRHSPRHGPPEPAPALKVQQKLRPALQPVAQRPLLVHANGAGAQAAHLSSPTLAPLLRLLRPSSRALRRHRLLLLAEGAGYRTTEEDAGKAAANKAANEASTHEPLVGRHSVRATLGSGPAIVPRGGPRCRIAVLGTLLDHSRAACNASQRCAQKAAAYQLQQQRRAKME